MTLIVYDVASVEIDDALVRRQRFSRHPSPEKNCAFAGGSWRECNHSRIELARERSLFRPVYQYASTSMPQSSTDFMGNSIVFSEHANETSDVTDATLGSDEENGAPPLRRVASFAFGSTCWCAEEADLIATQSYAMSDASSEAQGRLSIARLLTGNIGRRRLAATSVF